LPSSLGAVLPSPYSSRCLSPVSVYGTVSLRLDLSRAGLLCCPKSPSSPRHPSPRVPHLLAPFSSPLGTVSYGLPITLEFSAFWSLSILSLLMPASSMRCYVHHLLDTESTLCRPSTHVSPTGALKPLATSVLVFSLHNSWVSRSPKFALLRVPSQRGCFQAYCVSIPDRFLPSALRLVLESLAFYLGCFPLPPGTALPGCDSRPSSRSLPFVVWHRSVRDQPPSPN